MTPSERKIVDDYFRAWWTDTYKGDDRSFIRAYAAFIAGVELHKQMAIRDSDMQIQFSTTVDEMIDKGGL